MNLLDRRRRNIFLLLCAGSVLTMLLYGLVVVRRSRTSSLSSVANPNAAVSDKTAPGRPPNQPIGSRLSLLPKEELSASEPKNLTIGATAKARPSSTLLYFRANAVGDARGKLAVAPLDSLENVRYSAELSCDRVYFRNGHGVCLTRDVRQEGKDFADTHFLGSFQKFLIAFTGYSAVMFDEHLRPNQKTELNGIPSRVRVSPSGRLAAITVFLSGHSYASISFSTQTTIVDVESGRVLTDLESFAVTRQGEPFQGPDFNFWGVTFEREERGFYATLWSKGKSYLVECDLEKRTAKVIFEGVECPSLSPDNTRVAFKRRTEAVGAPTRFRISLLDLKTLVDIPLGEDRSIDDQVEWLDNDHVIYALWEASTGNCTSAVRASFDCSLNEEGSNASTDIWELPTRPNGSPRLLLRGAFSPAVVTIAK